MQVLGFMAAYCLLPFMVPVHVCCELLCWACASACASACAVQVQLHVMCCVCVCTRCRFFHVSIAAPGEVVLYATIIVYDDWTMKGDKNTGWFGWYRLVFIKSGIESPDV